MECVLDWVSQVLINASFPGQNHLDEPFGRGWPGIQEVGKFSLRGAIAPTRKLL